MSSAAAEPLLPDVGAETRLQRYGREASRCATAFALRRTVVGHHTHVDG